MKRQIAHISPHQTSKLIAVLYAIFTLPFTAIGVFNLLFGDSSEPTFSLFFIAAPVVYGIAGYVITVLGCWVYNFAAKRLGGLEFTVTDLPNA